MSDMIEECSIPVGSVPPYPTVPVPGERREGGSKKKTEHFRANK